MKSWLMHHRRALTATFAQMLKTPFASLFTLIAIGVTLSLPTGLYLLLDNLSQITAALPVHAEITVFMQDQAGPADINQLKRQLQTFPAISDSRFVPKQVALSMLSQQMGISNLASEIPANPLPDAWIITPNTTDPVTLKRLVAQLQQLPEVAVVQTDQQWAQRLDALLALGRYILTMLIILLAAALISISGNTIRLQILTRHAEIEVSRLIGATDSFIQRPFLYFGVMQGLMGGLIAWLLISLGIALLTPHIAVLAQLYASQFRLHNLSPGAVLILLATACAMGWLGAYVAVGRTLAQIEKPL
ncbi:MAG: permease-like cell division protein FtsX [Sulfuriferula sp.]